MSDLKQTHAPATIKAAAGLEPPALTVTVTLKSGEKDVLLIGNAAVLFCNPNLASKEVASAGLQKCLKALQEKRLVLVNNDIARPEGTGFVLDELKTLPVGVQDLFHSALIDWGLIMAAGMIIMVCREPAASGCRARHHGGRRR